MIMPASAMMPSVAMKPIGVFVVSSAVATPMRPSGATLITMASLAEASELHHEHREHQGDHERKLGQQGGVALRALFDRAAGLEQRACRHRLAQLVDRVGDALVNEGRLQSWQRLRLHGDGGQAAAAPDIALIELVLEIGELAAAVRRRPSAS